MKAEEKAVGGVASPRLVRFSSSEEEDGCQQKLEAWLEKLRSENSVKSVWEHMAFFLDSGLRDSGQGRVVYHEKDGASFFSLYLGGIDITLTVIDGLPNTNMFVRKHGIASPRTINDTIDGHISPMVKAHIALLASRKKGIELAQVGEINGIRCDNKRPDDLVISAEHGVFIDDGSPVSHNGESSNFLPNVKEHTTPTAPKP